MSHWGGVQVDDGGINVVDGQPWDGVQVVDGDNGGVNVVGGDYGGGVNVVGGDYGGGVNVVGGDYGGGISVVDGGDYGGGVNVVGGDYGGGVNVVGDDYGGGVNVVGDDYGGGVNVVGDDYGGGVNVVGGDYGDGGVRVAEAPRTSCTGGAPNNLPPLGFHRVHGENIRVSRDGSVARRVDSYKGVTFSARPVRVNEKVCIRFVEISKRWTGGILLGFTTHDPTTLAHALPKQVFPELTNKPGNWAQALSEIFCEKDNILYYYVNLTGDVHFGVNGEDKGWFFSGVDTRSPLWALMDLFGKCTAVQFADPRASNQVRSPNQSPVEEERTNSAMRSLSVEEPLLQPRYRNPLVPLSLHRTKGRNVQFINDRGEAARIEAKCCQGYVFTAHPMRPGQTIVIQILSNLTVYAGSLAIGLTSCDPETLRPCDLPNEALLLLDRPEYWVVRTDAANGLQRGDELAFTLTVDGEVRVSQNGSNPITVMHVDHTLRLLWAFVDIYGATQKVRMLSSQTAQTPPQQLRVLAGSAQPINTGSGGTVLVVSQPPQNGVQNGINQQMTLPSAHYIEPLQSSQLCIANLPLMSTPRTSCTGGAPNNLPPLGFHRVHGENIVVSRDGSVARRVESFNKGLAFSARPIRVNEKVCIRFVEITDGWCGGILLGFTTHDPTTLAHALPKYACPDLTNKPGNWAKALSVIFCEKDNILYYYVNSTGDVHFGVNGEDKGLFFSGVDTRSPLWALMDVFGNCIAVQFADPRASNQDRSPNQNPVEEDRIISAMRSLSVEEPLLQPRYQNPLVPLSLHRTKGRNVQFINDRGVAARIEAAFCQGYVFTTHPMRSGQTIVVQILSTGTAYAGSLAIGLTSCDPGTLRPCDLPDEAEQLLDRPEYWVVRRDAANGLQRGDELAFTLTVDGEVRVRRNGSNSITVMHVDHTLRLWAFVDIYGATQKVRMLSSETAQTPPQQLRVLTGSAQPINTGSGGTVLVVSQPPQNRVQNGSNQQMTLASAHYIEPIQSSQLCIANLPLMSTPRTSCTGGAPNNLPPLGFHRVHGENIVVSRDGSVARRVESFNEGLAFSTRPVRVNEKVCIRFAEISDGWSGAIVVGFTTHDPTTLAHALPKQVFPELTNKPGNWAQALSEIFCEKDNILYYYVNSTGDVHFGVNGEDKGLFFSGVDTRSPLWALMDVYGKCIAVQFADPRASNQDRSPNQNPVEEDRIISAMRSLSVEEPLLQPRYQNPLVPLSLHRTKGRNVQFINDRGEAARIEATFCQGYIFTAHPMRPGQTIVVQILSNGTAFVGSLAIGLTSCDPGTLRSYDLPDDPKQLLDRPEYWVVQRDAANGLQRGDELAFTLTVDGEVQVSRNGSNPITVMHVDHTQRLWAFVDIYGATQKVRMLSSQTAQTPRQQLRVLAGSAQPINAGSGGTVLVVTLPPQNRVQNDGNQQMTLARAHYIEPIQSSQLCLANLPPISPPSNLLPHPSYQQPRQNDHQCSFSQNSCNEQVVQPPERVETPSRSRMHPHTQPSYSVIGERQNLTGAECTICYENPIDSVLYMCGHMCMCYRCAVQQWRGKGGGQCPLCRAQIKDVIRTYKS